MAKFICIGPNHHSVKGLTSKAYTIRRLGRCVLTCYGSVQSIGGAGGRLHWAGRPRTENHRFRSEREAIEFVKKNEKTRESHGYRKLPGRVRIYPPLR